MKRFLASAFAALLSLSTMAATLNPIQLLNPAGSTSGQVIASTGATTAPAWTNVSISTLTGVLPVLQGGTGATTAAGALTNLGALSTATAASTYLTQANAASTYATITNLALKAPLASPTFTGSPTVPGYLTTATAASTYASLASPTLTGVPLAPTATVGTNTTQIATTTFANNAVAALVPIVVTSYTPVVTATSGTFTTATATGAYYLVGKLVFFEITATITTVGTASGNVVVTLPAVTSSVAGKVIFSGVETVTTGKMLQAFASSNTSSMTIRFYDASTPVVAGYVLTISGCYVSN